MVKEIYNKLKEKLDFYFEGMLSKESLGKWAEKEYYEMIKGRYIELQRLIVYPFLKTISKIHIVENEIKDEYPCSKEEIEFIRSVLYGQCEFNFQIELSIPIQVYNLYPDLGYFDLKRRSVYVELYNFILENKESNVRNMSRLKRYIDSIKPVDTERKTLQSIMERDIYKICQIILNNNFLEKEWDIEYRLYTRKKSDDYLDDKLMDYLKCYIGEQSFRIIVSYDEGEPDLLMLI